MRITSCFVFLCATVGIVVGSGLYLSASVLPPDKFELLATTEEEVSSFLNTLQNAVAGSDLDGFAGLVEFPLQVGACCGEQIIEEPEELRLVYDDLVNKNLRQAIMEQQTQDLSVSWQGMMIASGQLWFTVLCDRESEPGKCENQRTRIIRINYDRRECSSEEMGRDDRAESPPAPTLSMLIGSWVVVRHSCPGLCAMSNEEADSWIGRVALVSEQALIFDGKSCDNPETTVREWSEEEFYRDFRFDFEKLGISGDELRALEVSCRGREWASAGDFWIIKEENLSLVLWDGIFFELQKRY